MRAALEGAHLISLEGAEHVPLSAKPEKGERLCASACAPVTAAHRSLLHPVGRCGAAATAVAVLLLRRICLCAVAARTAKCMLCRPRNTTTCCAAGFACTAGQHWYGSGQYLEEWVHWLHRPAEGAGLDAAAQATRMAPSSDAAASSSV